MQQQQQIQMIRPQFTQIRDNLDLYVGFVTPLNSPFNFFVKKEDLKYPNDIIYFYAYSMGKNKVVIWGVYDPHTEEFLLDNNCKYNVSQMKEIVDNIQNNGYEYKFSASKNRISSSKIMVQLGISRKYSREIYDKFKSYFISKIVIYGHIKSKDIQEKYIINLNLDDTEYMKVINEIISLGSKINIDINYSSIKSEYPYKTIIDKYLDINNYILSLMTEEEYRTLKFINYFYKNTLDKTNRKELQNYIGGKFIMIWLDDLIRAFNIPEHEENNFIIDFTSLMLNYYENIVNREDIGVIGGRDIITKDESELLKILSNNFDDFITKSIYTKDTYVNELVPCPNKTKCDNIKDGICGLWNHGYNSQSDHDMR